MRGFEKEPDGILVADGTRKRLEAGGLDGGVLSQGFDHERADGDLLDEAGEDEAIAAEDGLVEGKIAAGIDVREHAPAEVDGLEDVALHAEELAGLRVDPHSSAETGEDLGGGVGRRPSGIRGEVDDDLAGALSGLDLGLSGRVGVEHGVGHELDELDREFLAAQTVVNVLVELCLRGDHLVEAVAFSLVFGGGEGSSVFEDEARDGSIAGLDGVADEISFGVDGADAVAQEGVGMADSADFAGGGVDDPGAGRSAEEVGRQRAGRGAQACGGFAEGSCVQRGNESGKEHVFQKPRPPYFIVHVCLEAFRQNCSVFFCLLLSSSVFSVFEFKRDGDFSLLWYDVRRPAKSCAGCLQDGACV